ncbi:hypothetical protein [Corynebacterium tapiri]|uniref:Secreted protein n=1 Tax=Corynebacterium tapiri TaxID=1448266 RepID=A0A5C4U1U7_9CORY|nr:hypothetical protein [Corynebacterium tapiri]TNL95722.1 hypothetical protein FHE74_08995 [Corynebacterium tapiri]
MKHLKHSLAAALVAGLSVSISPVSAMTTNDVDPLDQATPGPHAVNEVPRTLEELSTDLTEGFAVVNYLDADVLAQGTDAEIGAAARAAFSSHDYISEVGIPGVVTRDAGPHCADMVELHLADKALDDAQRGHIIKLIHTLGGPKAAAATITDKGGLELASKKADGPAKELAGALLKSENIQRDCH